MPQSLAAGEAASDAPAPANRPASEKALVPASLAGTSPQAIAALATKRISLSRISLPTICGTHPPPAPPHGLLPSHSAALQKQRALLPNAPIASRQRGCIRRPCSCQSSRQRERLGSRQPRRDLPAGERGARQKKNQLDAHLATHNFAELVRHPRQPNSLLPGHSAAPLTGLLPIPFASRRRDRPATRASTITSQATPRPSRNNAPCSRTPQSLAAREPSAAIRASTIVSS